MLNDRIETIIIYNLLTNEDYTKKILPFIIPEYFTDYVERVIFVSIKDYVALYNSSPTKEAIIITISDDKKIKEQALEDVTEYFETRFLEISKEYNSEWLHDSTEKWCKEKALYNGLMESIAIANDQTGKLKPTSAIPDIMRDAMSVGFNTNIGHDYIADSDSRFAFYHRKEEKIPFDITLLNRITDGGLSKKSLNIFVGGTGTGKSLIGCHFASSYLTQGKNVLYVTLEMAEEKIAERIDANLLDVSVNDLQDLPRAIYDRKIEKIRNTTLGKLIIKEYPTASAHVGHIKALLNDLKLKKNFVPDIMIVDYINIMASSRIKISSGGVNSYTWIKSIAEELRGLSMEFSVPVITFTQLNRANQSATSVDFDGVSESHGLSMSADLLVAIIRTEELDELNQMLFQQLKNRYSDVTTFKRFVVGIDRPKMRIYNVDQPTKNLAGAGGIGKKGKQTDDDDVSAFDNGKFGEGMKAERKESFGKRDFSKIKV